MLETYMIEHKRRDGITAYKYLRSLSAPQDADSQHIAITRYRNLLLNDREFIQTFNGRFNSIVTNVIATGVQLQQSDVVDQYLCAIKTVQNSQIQVKITLYRERRKSELQEHPTITELVLTQIQSEFQREEEQSNDTANRQARAVSTRAQANSAASAPSTRTTAKKQAPKSSASASAPTTTKTFDDSAIVCLGCNVKGHRLRNCKTTSSIDRRGIIDKLKADQANRFNAANNAETPPNPPKHTANTAEHQPQHFANVAQTRHKGKKNFKAESSRYYTTNQFPTRVVVYESDVLIDSGATEHMTGEPSVLDNPYDFYSSVTTADGSTVQTTKAGTMRSNVPAPRPTQPSTFHCSTQFLSPFSRSIFGLSPLLMHPAT
jgi:ribosomal protein L11